MLEAVEEDDGSRITRLIRSGVDPNRMLPNEMTLLCTAAYFGHRSAVEALLAGGADPDIESLTGQDALHRFVAPAAVCAQLGAANPQNSGADYSAIERLLRGNGS